MNVCIWRERMGRGRRLYVFKYVCTCAREYKFVCTCTREYKYVCTCTREYNHQNIYTAGKDGTRETSLCVHICMYISE